MGLFICECPTKVLSIKILDVLDNNQENFITKLLSYCIIYTLLRIFNK